MAGTNAVPACLHRIASIITMPRIRPPNAGDPNGKPLLHFALNYARRGWHVFPCSPLNKRPLVGKDIDANGNKIEKTGGFYKATTNEDQIRAWWKQWPNGMIGVRMGTASGVWALDPDAPDKPGATDGRQSWIDLQQKHGAAPPTHTHNTPGGGQHLLFLYRADKPVTTAEGALKGLGINVRGEGGYIIAPPSAIADGKSYEMAEPLDFFKFAEAPIWLYDLVLAEPAIGQETAKQSNGADATFNTVFNGRERKWALAALRNAAAELTTTTEGSRNIIANAKAYSMGRMIGAGFIDEPTVRAGLWQSCVENGLVQDTGRDAVLATLDSGLKAGVANPHPPLSDRKNSTAASPEEIVIETLPPMTLLEWRDRDLPSSDFLLGNILTTTTRCLLTADTGLGKTNLALAMTMRMAAGVPFLHWRACRPCRVLYIDGEMSRKLLRQRLLDEAERLGSMPEGFHAINREDIPDMLPLNDSRGQAWIDALIQKMGGIDFVCFDNIMCLTVGNPKDPESWQATLPWALTLTHRQIGQVWVHHTGHDATRGYGDKSREWQMDTVIHLDAAKRPDTDVSFKASFKKARERTPLTRTDFQEVTIALVDDVWEHSISEGIRPGKINALTAKALDALTNVIGSSQAVTLSGKRRAASTEHWKAECLLLGLLDGKAKPNVIRATFSKFRTNLIAANRIACEGEWSWLIH
jgi:Bifunctional DNA primase/polymerase, N-terminal/AAA domain